MSNFSFVCGRNVYDFFVLPTIRVNDEGNMGIFITIEWLMWYVGISIEY
jgi:hypothetical protein